VPFLLEQVRELSLAAAHVEHARGRRAHELEQLRVRAQVAPLQGVRGRDLVLRVMTQAELVQLELDH